MKYVSAILLLGSLVLAVIEIIRRYVIGETFVWGQDAVTYFILASVYIFFCITQRRDANIKMTILLSMLSGGRRGKVRDIIARLLKAMARLMTFLFVVWFICWGVNPVIYSTQIGRTGESLIFPLWPFYILLLIGFVFLGITLFFQLYKDLQALGSKETVEQEELAEEGVL